MELRIKVLVTGANGFVAHHVIKELGKRGYTVYGTDSTPPRSDNVTASFYQGDICNYDFVWRLVNDCTPSYVVHLAAVHYIPYCNAHPGETYAVNVIGTHNLLEALKGRLVCKVFLASSAGVYTPSDLPHSETDPAWPVDMYGLTKAAVEHAGREWSWRTGIPVVIGRYFNMYGWGETTLHLIPTLVEQAGKSDTIRLGNVDARRDFVHVTDNARATCDLLELEHIGPITVNLGSGLSYSANNLVGLLSAILRKELVVITDSTRVRKGDRPNLVADTTLFYQLGLSRPSISLWDGLNDLVKTGVGPYLKDPMERR